ncbi:MAG: hypothetical protein JNK53_02970, partial [Phycisphaerae bacterium]|nr:hypothetical protein [Phycisphaerae bacterium]
MNHIRLLRLLAHRATDTAVVASKFAAATAAVALIAGFASRPLAAPPAAWKPAAGPLQTRWTAAVAPETAWSEYPRPQFARNTRDEWRSLNGLWEYVIRPRTDDGTLTFPAKADGRILVPFPVESQLSGVAKPVRPEQELVYRRSFDVPADFKAAGARTLLHFGAVDWHARVSVNGTPIGSHQGGFEAFSFDITDSLRAGANELLVAAWDPTDASTQPRGKQVLKPGGIFYTAVTGIWQTVWLERLPGTRVHSLTARTDRATGALDMRVELAGDVAAAHSLAIQVLNPDGTASASLEVSPPGTSSQPKVLLPNVRAWSPADPALYDIVATLTDAKGAVLDRVRTYAAFRDVALVRPNDGPPRIELNGKPIFMVGTLDQGWWPDGLYTPPTPEAMRYDLEVTRALGFNTIRKHVKVECAAWYAACDRMGILVWQDMPSGDGSISPTDADLTRKPASAAAYEAELAGMINALRPFPSIVLWVPFNEGWGQFDSARITDAVRALDSTRLVT